MQPTPGSPAAPGPRVRNCGEWPWVVLVSPRSLSHRTLSRVRTARYHYKRDQPGGEPLASSAPYELSHYRDDSVPWEGILVQYFAKLAGSSYPVLGSSPSWVLTWTSASSRAQYTSSWTAAVSGVPLQPHVLEAATVVLDAQPHSYVSGERRRAGHRRHRLLPLLDDC